MKDSGEVFENVKEQATQHEASHGIIGPRRSWRQKAVMNARSVHGRKMSAEN